MLSHIPLSSLSESVLKRSVPCFFDEYTNTFFHIDIPDETVSSIPRICVKNENDVASIPPVGGNYWILTNELILHCFHSGNRKVPLFQNGLRVVYNGVTTNLQNRAREHLLRPDEKGGSGSQSGISVDVLCVPEGNPSHVKCAWSSTGKRKLPKVFVNNSYVPLTKKDDLFGTFSENEKEFALTSNTLYFKNGIHVSSAKHSPYGWFFAYAPISVPNVRDYVENAWRDAHGVPILCSYLSGR
jgi:hypothetical protein